MIALAMSSYLEGEDENERGQEPDRCYQLKERHKTAHPALAGTKAPTWPTCPLKKKQGQVHHVINMDGQPPFFSFNFSFFFCFKLYQRVGQTSAAAPA